MNNLRRLSAVLTLSAVTCVGDTRPPAKVEAALRSRVSRFYTLIVKKKYREAEQLVAPESRDAYYEQEKSAIKDFKITEIAWSDKFGKADVNLISLVTMRRAVIGAFDVHTPYASHWTFERGQWFWYVPHVSERQTPFGIMRVNPDAAAGSGVNLSSMIAKGPSPHDLISGVKVSSAKITIPRKNGSAGSVTLENSLPGIVDLSIDASSAVGMAAELSRHTLGLNDKGMATIRRTTDQSSTGVISIHVKPTGQIIKIFVE